MTTPDTETRLADAERRLRQQGDDVTALYELVERVDEKVTALDVKVDQGFASTDRQLNQLGGRSLQQSSRLDQIEDRLTQINGQLETLIARLGDQ